MLRFVNCFWVFKSLGNLVILYFDMYNWFIICKWWFIFEFLLVVEIWFLERFSKKIDLRFECKIVFKLIVVGVFKWDILRSWSNLRFEKILKLIGFWVFKWERLRFWRFINLEMDFGMGFMKLLLLRINDVNLDGEDILLNLRVFLSWLFFKLI